MSRAKPKAKPKPRGAQERKRRRDATRVAVERAQAGIIDPVEAMIAGLAQAVGTWEVARDEAAKIKPSSKDFWRDTMVGRIPNEWIRLEVDTREQMTGLATRMIGLDIADRRTKAAELVAMAMVPVFEAVCEELKLTAAQKRALPGAIRKHMTQLELPEGGSTSG